MIQQLIEANPSFGRELTPPDLFDSLDVAEFFCDTIQGEGINIGHPATFLRLQRCTLDCTYCDTQEVWRFGNPYTFDELFELMLTYNVISKLMDYSQHLVLTGGSPLKQQYTLIRFLQAFFEKFRFMPYIEIENECTLIPNSNFTKWISCWNNSPKLSSSGNKRNLYYKPEILLRMSELSNSWFKFVISDKTDWQEIQMDYLDTNLIKKSQVILMPLGETKAELERNREMTLQLAITHGVRFTDRLHITIWDKKTGV